MELIKIQRDEGFAVLTLNQGVTNPINQALMDELGGVLADFKDDAFIRSLVLGSESDKFFSIGLDIPRLFDLDVEAFADFYRRVNQMCLELYTFPKPVVAALGGHAIAAGCIVALCCDYRLMANGRKLMGLNEIKIGVPVPYLADCILRDLIGPRLARDVMEGGEFFGPDDLLKMGMVDAVMPQDALLDAAIVKAQALGAYSSEAFAAIKRSRVDRVVADYRARVVEKDEEFLACWYSDQGRTLIAEAMTKF